jgi:peptide/nickel transport system permease protein
MRRTLTAALATVLRAIMGLLGVSLIAFPIIRAMPADPAAVAIRAWNLPATEEVARGLRQAWGLDLPIDWQYLHWIGRFVLGDWGTSFRTGGPILGEFLHRLPLSLGIGVGALGVAVALAVPLGFLAARRPGGLVDRLSRVLAIAAKAIPSFWLGLALLWLLAVKWRVLDPVDETAGLVALAVVLVAFTSLGTLARVYRRGLIEAERQPFFRAALAKGLPPGAVLWRHGHRHAACALLASLRAEAGWAIGGTATVEVLLGLPGISQFLVQSVAARDYFVLQAYVMVVAMWMIAINAAIGLFFPLLDPRLRSTGERS